MFEMIEKSVARGKEFITKATNPLKKLYGRLSFNTLLKHSLKKGAFSRIILHLPAVAELLENNKEASVRGT
jgi:hypothetical protein